MTLSDSFWSFTRLADSWSTTTPLPKPRRRTAVFTQQHIETIGGGNKHAFKSPPAPVLGDPRLPIELIVHIAFIAADQVSADEIDASLRLLELAAVNRACYRAVMSSYLLPDLCLYGLQQIRSFATSLDKDSVGIRALARTRLQSLSIRARSRRSLQHGYGPALFDASQAQVHFEKDLLPFIRVILAHCHALQTLRLEGVPRGLQHHLARLSDHLSGYDCLMGLYGADLDRDFWLPQRWSRLAHLQLHGPRFRFTPNTATALACLPQLKKLGLIVPMIASSPSTPLAAANGAIDTVELDVTGGINPLQILVDRCPTLERLLLVGHAETGYVGFAEKYRHWLRGLRRPRTEEPSSKMRVELVTALRRSGVSNEDDDTASKRRIHPCEVSAWIMARARDGLQWFDSEQNATHDGELEYWVESFELAEPNASTAATTTTTSALMSRTGSHSAFGHTHRARQQQQPPVVDDAIEAADMLSNDEISSDES